MKNFSSKSIDIICLLLFLAFLCMPNKLFAIEHPELYADYQIDSSLTISVTDSGYWINFSLEPDSIRVLTLTNTFGQFDYLKLPCNDNYDLRDEFGLPALPIRSLNLQVPGNMHGSTLQALHKTCNFSYLNLENSYMPYWDTNKSTGIDSFIISNNYYDNVDDYDFLGNTIEISPVIACFNANGIVLNIMPVQYNATAKRVRILSHATFFIPAIVSEINSARELRDGENFYEPLAFWKDMRGYMGQTHDSSNGKIFVITMPEYTDSLQLYASYKRRNHYSVDIYSMNDIIDTVHIVQPNWTESLVDTKTFINTFLTYMAQIRNITPDYLLIVANPSDIPFSTGIITDMQNPASDFTYDLNAYSDIQQNRHLEINYSIGRWPVIESKDVTNITKKVIAFETGIFNQSLSDLVAMGISGTGNDNSFDDSQAYQLSKFVKRMRDKGLMVDEFDGRYNSASHIDGIFHSDEYNENLWLIYYTGHGSEYGLGSPFNISGNDEIKFNIPPINYSFACLTNAMTDATNFGYYWIKNLPFGGVANYGSTTTTQVYTDLFFSKNMFIPFSMSNTLGRNIAKGLMKYYNASMTPTRAKQIRRYNLFGDPSLTLTGAPAYPISHIVENTYNRDYNIGYSGFLQCINSSLYYDIDSEGTYNLDIIDINGKIVYSQQVTNSGIIDCSQISKGMYVAIISSNNGDFYASEKFVIGL